MLGRYVLKCLLVGVGYQVILELEDARAGVFFWSRLDGTGRDWTGLDGTGLD